MLQRVRNQRSWSDRRAAQPGFHVLQSVDDNIDLNTYFQRCWPNSEHIKVFDLLRIFVQGDEAFVTYEAENTGGRRFRNTEFFRFKEGKLVHVDVYFGPDNLRNSPQGIS